MPDLTSREPVVTVGSIGAVAAAALVLLTAFGLPITEDQQQAILGFIAVATPLVLAFIARRFVTPNGSVLEWTPDGKRVLAGEANDVKPKRAKIRDVGSMPPAPPAQ